MGGPTKNAAALALGSVAKASSAAARLMSQVGYARAPPTAPAVTPLGQLTFGFR